MNIPLFSFVRQSVDSLSQALIQVLRQWTKPNNHALVLNAAVDLTRSRSELVLENMLLRQQLIVLKRGVARPAPTWRDRSLFVLLASKLRTGREALLIVPPDTVLRWHLISFRRTISSSERCSCSSSSSWPRDAWYTMV